jgi:hypothetical protein
MSERVNREVRTASSPPSRCRSAQIEAHAATWPQAPPAELPFEQVTKLEPVVNLRTATTLGLTIRKSVLLQADRVIK